MRTAGASRKTQTWVRPGRRDSARDAPWLPASRPLGKEGRRGRRRQSRSEAGGSEAGARRTTAPGRREGLPTVLHPTKNPEGPPSGSDSVA